MISVLTFHRSSILIRLLLALLLPTLVLLFLFGIFTYRRTNQTLEESLGKRLISIAAVSASQISIDALNFLSPGDDDSKTAQRIRAKLNAIVKQTGVRRIFILDIKLRSKADTQQQAKIGEKHYEAESDRLELSDVFNGKKRSSILFKGEHDKRYKRGYAPIFDPKTKSVIAALGVEGSALYFESLTRLRRQLITIGIVISLLIILATLLSARRITKPLRQLANAAKQIGEGTLTTDLRLSNRQDEVALLAHTMNKMRIALKKRQEELELMLSGIAHEVRNPLGGITLFAGLLRDEVKDDPEQLEMVQRIERELEYLKNVVHDFLSYARKMPLNRSSVELITCCNELVELCAADLNEKEIDIQIEGKPLTLSIDRDLFRRVLLNIIRNAIIASDPKESITVRIEQLEKHAQIAIEDHGHGIKADLLEKIFTPFFTTREQGTGLGLALCKKIIEDHHGTISVESEINKGTRFTIKVPLENEENPLA